METSNCVYGLELIVKWGKNIHFIAYKTFIKTYIIVLQDYCTKQLTVI